MASCYSSCTPGVRNLCTKAFPVAGLLLTSTYPDLDMESLKDGNDIPSLCVRLWWLGDFFNLQALTDAMEKKLGAYLDTTLMHICNSDVRPTESFKEISAIDAFKNGRALISAVREAYEYDHLRSMQGLLVAFFWAARCSSILGVTEHQELMEDVPDYGKDLLKALTTSKIASISPWVTESAATLAMIKRPRVRPDRNCDSCETRLGGFPGLYNPFLVDHSVSDNNQNGCEDGLWCKDCATNMRNTNYVPWREDTDK